VPTRHRSGAARVAAFSLSRWLPAKMAQCHPAHRRSGSPPPTTQQLSLSPSAAARLFMAAAAPHTIASCPTKRPWTRRHTSNSKSSSISTTTKGLFQKDVGSCNAPSPTRERCHRRLRSRAARAASLDQLRDRDEPNSKQKHPGGVQTLGQAKTCLDLRLSLK
jgi:hypothetical protein